MINFWVKLISFILTGVFVGMGNWESAAIFFMLYLGELSQSVAQSICETIENKQS